MTTSNITGITVDASVKPAPILLAEGWLHSWQSLGGAVTIGPTGQIVPWMHFADRKAVKVSCRLVNQLLDTPGLPLALRTLIEKVAS
jgi:hypothetical protein